MSGAVTRPWRVNGLDMCGGQIPRQSDKALYSVHIISYLREVLYLTR